MINHPQEGASVDEVLEYAARLIEDPSFLDIAGIWAKRKRDREDADLRRKTIEQARKDFADHIRAFKGRRDMDLISELRDIAALEPADSVSHVVELRRAWPLAWKRLVKIEVTIDCADNTIPPAARYRISLTEKGRELLSITDSAP